MTPASPCPVLYLHGFASGPASKKARFFADHLAARHVPFLVPDLAAGDFEHLTLSGQMDIIRRTVEGGGAGRVRLIGSSLGGYLAALYAAQHPERIDRLVLLAPAFDFAARWRLRLGEAAFGDWERSGCLPVFHYGEGRQVPLAFGLYTDALGYPPFPSVARPALVFHGRRDDVVPASLSEQFAASNPQVRLRLLDSDHQLLDVTEKIWEETWAFFQG